MESKIKTGECNKNIVVRKETRERAAGYDECMTRQHVGGEMLDTVTWTSSDVLKGC